MRSCTASNTLNRTYDDVIISADPLQLGTLVELSCLPIWVIPVSIDNSQKARSLNVVMVRLPGDYYDSSVGR